MEYRSEKDDDLMQRHLLASCRIEELKDEIESDGIIGSFFKVTSDFICKLELIHNKITSYDEILNKELISYLKSVNKPIYEDILPSNYIRSFADPQYIVREFEKHDIDKEYARLLSYLYAEIRGLIPYIYEDRLDIVTIYEELFLEIYGIFDAAGSEGKLPQLKELKDAIYWFNFDNCDIVSAQRVLEQIDPSWDFALRIIMEADLDDTDYLYRFGEYISENEVRTARFINGLSSGELKSMADTYTEGYRIGFVKAGKPLDKKETVNIRYCLGFERMVREAVKNFEKMGLKPIIYRASGLSLNRRGSVRVGYYGAIPCKQFDYDHREDNVLYLNKDFVNRKVGVIKKVYEDNKVLAGIHAGPAVIEVFGEEPFTPQSKAECLTQDIVAQKFDVELSDRLGQLTNQYIRGDERSFTIISYPTPEIGPDFTDIFRETVRINTLDYKRYEEMQQTVIELLDRAEKVHIVGKGANRTDIVVALHGIEDRDKQSVFENCVADVNIPVGEVFTSPKLKGTNGTLHVTGVFLNGLKYDDLELVFKDGMIEKYSCANFDNEEDDLKFIKDNLLFHHDTLPMGEFAIGTNTAAYRMARDHHIEAKLPILIGEKTGPHFAVGDTCYSYCEDVKVYNPDGKEIIARDNEITAKYRRSDPSKAYFHCHTDITIPYDELYGIYAVMPDGSKEAIIEDSLFVLKGLEELNIPLKK